LADLRKRLAPNEATIGMRMRDLFAVAKAHTGLPLDEVDRLLDHPAYEPRMAGFCILDFKARRQIDDDERRTHDSRASHLDLDYPTIERSHSSGDRQVKRRPPLTPVATRIRTAVARSIPSANASKLAARPSDPGSPLFERRSGPSTRSATTCTAWRVTAAPTGGRRWGRRG